MSIKQNGMKSGRMRIAGAALLILLAYTFVTANRHKTDEPVQVGRPAPDIQVTNMNGSPVKLSDYRGQGVLLNFWGSWCVPCVSEMPRLKAAYESEDIHGVEIVAVNVGESKGTIMEFIRLHAIPFHVMTDPSGEAANAYRVNGLPATFLINAQGLVKRIIPGELTNTQQIRSLMESVQPQPQPGP
ncbi:redoxin domain-containing protein [Paenibacillus doosanensis]|uniref:redoxin domain-containing protein n=1 Tax=Paenibacillus doosanensis TaxID=1229154 RepID=UPI00218018B6|nr:redoxin domain-containing protein [Paenibacillus doosanensis]MCS7460572.1 redoxin domain-containing protein [Paenibacillus doosanensis]